MFSTFLSAFIGIIIWPKFKIKGKEGKQVNEPTSKHMNLSGETVILEMQLAFCRGNNINNIGKN